MVVRWKQKMTAIAGRCRGRPYRCRTQLSILVALFKVPLQIFRIVKQGQQYENRVLKGCHELAADPYGCRDRSTSGELSAPSADPKGVGRRVYGAKTVKGGYILESR